MAAAAVIGEALAVEGYALAGAMICAAQDYEEAVAAFQALPADTALLIMTASAAEWLADGLRQRPEILAVVMRP
jgi:vacuolar-type H+-ATPase subunit F/Vma7